MIAAYYHGEKFEIETTENKKILAAMLNYLNSLGDPIFPIDNNWKIPETDINNLDITELRNVFIQELEFEKNEFPGDFYIDGFGLEIFEI